MSQEGKEEGKPETVNAMQVVMENLKKTAEEEGKDGVTPGLIPIPGEDIQIEGARSKHGSMVSQGNKSSIEDSASVSESEVKDKTP